MKNEKVIVQLRVYKGQVTYNERGEVTSQNQLMKLGYGLREWQLFLKNIAQMGWTKVDVVKCLDGNNDYKEMDIPGVIVEEIKAAMSMDKAQLTPEQREIKELKEQMAELMKGKSKQNQSDDSAKEKAEAEAKAKAEAEAKAKAEAEAAAKKQEEERLAKEKAEAEAKELENARLKYEEVFGKQPHHKKTIEAINKEIEEKQNS